MSVNQSRFWETAEPELNTGCWLWSGPTMTGGYGSAYVGNYRKRGAHRVAYEIAKGEIPRGMLVCHRCDTRACINPDHLFLGTHADNSADMVAKGRARPGLVRGGLNAKTKIAPEDIPLIRAARGAERQEDTARRFGISQVMVSRIQRKMSWAHVA